jgi:hypothetical protein
MDVTPSRVISGLLGVLLAAVLFLWVSFVFAPAWLDRLAAWLSSCC